MIEHVIPDHVPPELVQLIRFTDAPGIDREPAPTLDVLRDSRPIVYTPESHMGFGSWVIKNFDLIFEAFQKPELFSSERYSGFSALVGDDWSMPPMEYDPPHNQAFRLLLNPLFAPRRIAEMEAGVTATVRTLLDGLRPKGGCEFQSEFGVRLPTTIFLQLVGLPLEDAPMLLGWERQLMHGKTVVEQGAGAKAIKEYLLEHIRDRERNKKDDVFSYIVHAQVEGRSLTPNEKLGVCFLLYGAGLDTVASALGFLFRFLGQHPDRQEELRRRPDQRQWAIEEIMRANMNNIPGRWVTKDLEFHGVKMRKGDYVSLPTMFANRDPSEFDQPAVVDFDRANAKRHIAFGTGIHSCLGKHLARRELGIALNGWLDDMPPFKVGSRHPVTYGGPVFGVASLDLSWTPSGRA